MRIGPYDVPGHYTGDALECLRRLPDESVHCCVTSPPYWQLRSYLEDDDPAKAQELGSDDTPESFVARMVEVFGEVRRVLRLDGTCWAVLGDGYAGSRGGPQGSTGERAGRSFTAEGCGVGRVSGLKDKDLIGMPWRVALALQADGWWLRSDVIWHKPNPMPESCTDRPTSAHEHVFLLTKAERYFYDAEAVKQPVSGGAHPRGQGVHPKTAPAGSGVKQNENYSAAVRGLVDRRNMRNVWTVPTVGYSGSHYAVYPPEIPKRCIMAGCPPDGIVLDPFHGSGTTGMVAEDLGRSWLGFDLDARNEALVKQRTAQRGLLTVRGGG